MRRPTLLLFGVVVLLAAAAVVAAAAPPPAPACPVCGDRMADAIADDDEVSSEATVRVRSDGTAVWVVENDVGEATATDLPDEQQLATDLERTASGTRGFDGTVESIDVSVDNGGSVAVELVVSGTVERHAGAWVYTGLYVPPGETASGYWANADRLVVEGPENGTAVVAGTGTADGDRVVVASGPSDDATEFARGSVDRRTTIAFASDDGVVDELRARAALLGYWLPLYAPTMSITLLPIGVFAAVFGVGVTVSDRIRGRIDSPPVPGARTLAAAAGLAVIVAAVAPPLLVDIVLGAAALLAPIAAARSPTVVRRGRRTAAVLAAPVAAGLAVAAGRAVAARTGAVEPLAAGAAGTVGFAAVIGTPMVAGLVFGRGRRAAIGTVAIATALVFVGTVLALGPAAGPRGLTPVFLAVFLGVFGAVSALIYGLGVVLDRPLRATLRTERSEGQAP